MRILRKFTLSILVFAGCSTNQAHQAASRHIAFDSINSLSFEGANCDSVMKELGSPQRSQNFADSQGTTKVYTYLQHEDSNTAPYAELVFNGDECHLVYKRWYPGRDEPESIVSNAKARFPGASFKTQPHKQSSPDSLPHQLDYVSDEIGVSITFNKARNEVESISWSPVPVQSKLASQRKPSSKSKK